VLVVCNLKPAKMAGFESAGMVLCASNPEHTQVELLEVPEGAAIGERVFIEGLTGEPLQPNQVMHPSYTINRVLREP
jgi:tRNA-binding EMAP/Myf-like protein